MPVCWDSSALLLQLSQRQCCSLYECCSSSWRNSLIWKLRVRYTETEVKLAYAEKSTHPWSLISPFSCKWKLQILTAWLVQKALSWLVRMDQFWLISEDANKDTAEDANENIAVQLWLNGKVSVQFVEIWFQELLYMNELWRQEHSTGGLKLSAAFPWSTNSMWGPYLAMTTRLYL